MSDDEPICYNCDDTNEVDCPLCEGSGYDEDGDGEECPECQGEGIVECDEC